MKAGEFVIHFGSLAPGEYEFEFEINDTFFQKFENSIIQKGSVDVLVVLEKKDNLLLFDFTMEGTVVVTCDRCLEDLYLEIEGYNELVVKYGQQSEELTDNVVVIPTNQNEIDVSQYIYEYLTLMIPMRNVHGDEEGQPECDPEILKEMEKHISQEQNNSTDPRWDGLKNINLN